MKRKNKFNFVDPTVIVAVFVSLIVLAVGVYAVFTVITNTQDDSIGASPTFSRTFTPTTNPNTYNGLPDNTQSITSVEEYYDGAWHDVTAGTGYYWNQTSNNLIVNATGWG